MSAKCKICGMRIFDEDGRCDGARLPNGDWVCYDTDCAEFSIAVVQAARAVVAAQDDALQSDAEDVAKIWDAIEKLREALAR